MNDWQREELRKQWGSEYFQESRQVETSTELPKIRYCPTSQVVGTITIVSSV